MSIRSPKNNPEGAGQFSSGGGRKSATGINRLKESEVPELVNLLEQRYG